MKEQWMKMLQSIKDFWGKLSQKVKVIILASAAALLILLAVVITVAINQANTNYEILYPGITQSETLQVYAELQEMEGVDPLLDNKGQLLVPSEQKDGLILQLAGKGYPQSTLAYDTFLSNTGFTMTEMEKKELLVYQLQDRLQDTIRIISGVDSAIVTINIPDTSTYVWETNPDQSTASVMLTLEKNVELEPEQVLAVRNLVAYATPKLDPENVRIIDARTGIDLGEQLRAETEGDLNFKRLEYESEIERKIVNKVKELLSSVYGSNVTAVATVRLNYDATKSETRELLPGDDGNGYKTHQEEQYNLNGAVGVGDIVGEENNTDIPGYVNGPALDNDGQTTSFSRSTDWQVGERIIQTENGQAYIEDASVSVLVQDPNFTIEKQERLVEIVSKGVLINRNSVSVEYIDLGNDSLPVDTEPGEEDGSAIWRNWIFWAVIGGVFLLLLIILIVVILLIRRKGKKKVMAASAEAEDLMRSAQEEINEHKRMLAEAAQANSNPKDNAIVDEVRDFAKQNPEITATLIRSLLKEE